MISNAWIWLRDPANRQTLAWIGASAIAILGLLGWKINTGEDCQNPINNDIAGTWWSDGNNVTMTIERKACSVNSNFGVAPAPRHELAGRYKDGVVNFTTKRTDDKNCTVVFYGNFNDIKSQQMKSHVYKTSGACGFSEGWQENLTWVRRG